VDPEAGAGPVRGEPGRRRGQDVPGHDGYRDRLPFRFTGKIDRIEVKLGESAELTTAELIDEQLHAD
jgi:hypothetical protein